MQLILWLRSKPDATAIGDLVFFRPLHTAIFITAEERGYLESDNYLLKKLVATSGDVITIDDNGVTVNGAKLANSKPRKIDGRGNPLKAAVMTDYRLAIGEVLLMSDYSPRSFDARYFGVQNEAGIIGTAYPVWLWQGEIK